MASPHLVGKRILEFLNLPNDVIELTLHVVADEFPTLAVKRRVLETGEVVTEEGRLYFEKNGERDG